LHSYHKKHQKNTKKSASYIDHFLIPKSRAHFFAFLLFCTFWLCVLNTLFYGVFNVILWYLYHKTAKKDVKQL